MISGFLSTALIPRTGVISSETISSFDSSSCSGYPDHQYPIIFLYLTKLNQIECLTRTRKSCYCLGLELSLRSRDLFHPSRRMVFSIFQFHLNIIILEQYVRNLPRRSYSAILNYLQFWYSFGVGISTSSSCPGVQSSLYSSSTASFDQKRPRCLFEFQNSRPHEKNAT